MHDDGNMLVIFGNENSNSFHLFDKPTPRRKGLTLLLSCDMGGHKITSPDEVSVLEESGVCTLPLNYSVNTNVFQL